MIERKRLVPVVFAILAVCVVTAGPLRALAGESADDTALVAKARSVEAEKGRTGPWAVWAIHLRQPISPLIHCRVQRLE